MKKFRILCAAALICLIPGAAMAADTPVLIAANPMTGGATMPQAGGVQVLSSFGVVEEIGTDYVVVKLDEGASVARVQLNIGEDSVILDNVSGKAVKLADIKAGDRVFAHYSDMLTKSIPAQTEMVALFTNVESSTPGLVWTVESIDGNIAVVDNGGLFLTMPEGVTVKAGDRIAAWYENVMMSLPAQAVADRVVVLASVEASVPEKVEPTVVEPQGVAVNGETVADVVEKVNGEYCVPLRAVAEKLGFELTWDGNRMSATIAKGEQTAQFTMDSDTLVVDGDMAHKLGAPVYLRNKEVMFVPVKALEMLGLTVVVGEQVEINA